jgi:hypothetical protein
MFCPKCGNRQLSDDIRFCAKCGLALTAARESLTGATVLAGPNKNPKGLSPKAKGVLQGIGIIPAGIGVMAVLDIFYEALGARMMAGLYATLTMIVLVAIARIAYALVMESGSARATPEITARSNSAELGPGVVTSSDILPAQPRATGEMIPAASITEHTTRQLRVDK